VCVCNANASVGRDIEVVPGRGRPERRRQLISKTIEVDVYKKQTGGEEKGEIITIIRIIPENVFFFFLSYRGRQLLIRRLESQIKLRE